MEKNEVVKIKMPEVEFDRIQRSYNGNSGCMCGCNGSYSYTEISGKTEKKYGNPIPKDEISNRRVKIALAKLKAAETVTAHEGFKSDNVMIYVIDNGRRTTVLYVKNDEINKEEQKKVIAAENAKVEG